MKYRIREEKTWVDASNQISTFFIEMKPPGFLQKWITRQETVGSHPAYTTDKAYYRLEDVISEINKMKVKDKEPEVIYLSDDGTMIV